jgi:hypothetical protein
MTTNARFCFRNFHDEATVTASTEANEYPATDTQNYIRDAAWRSTTTSSSTILGTFSRNRVINWWGMFRHREHGGQVRFEGFTNDNWTGAATGGDTGIVNVNKIVGSSGDTAFAWGDDPYGAGQYDPLLIESPYWYYFASPVTIRSYRITLSSHSTTYWNDDYHHVGRIWVGKYFQPRVNPSYDGFGFGWRDNTERSRSRGGSLRSNIGSRWREARMQLDGIDENEAPVWNDGIANSQMGKDIFASMFPEDETRLERDNMGLFKLASLNPIGRQVSRLTTSLQLEEI